MAAKTLPDFGPGDNLQLKLVGTAAFPPRRTCVLS